MKLNWLLCAALLLVGTSSIQAQEDDFEHGDDDAIDIEDDLDDGVEEVEELKHEPSTPPPPPKVWLIS